MRLLPTASAAASAAAVAALLLLSAGASGAFAPARSRHASASSAGAVVAVPSFAPDRPVPCASPSRAALSMGLRNFLKGKLGKKKDGEGDDGKRRGRGGKAAAAPPEPGGKILEPAPSSEADGPSSPKWDLYSAASAVSSPPAAAPPAGPIRQPLPEDLPPSVARGRGRAPESVQERIARVKSGRMTEKEKAAFLRAALSRPLDPRGAPIVSDGDDDEGGEGDKPSPFPRETLWSTVLGHGDGSVSSSSSSSSSASSSSGASASGGRRLPFDDLDDKAKRAYLDMVMDPGRFRRYGYGGVAEEESKKEEAGERKEPRTYYPSEDLLDNPSEEPFEQFAEGINYAAGIDAAVAAGEEDAIAAAADDDAEQEGSDGGGDEEKDKSWAGGFFDLGSRLEAAAHAKEEQDQKARAEAEARRAEEKRRLDEIRRFQEEEAQRRMLEAKRKEAEVRARREEEEERARWAEREKKEAEERRLREMQEAQDAYWAKQLAAERERREKMAGVVVDPKDEEKRKVAERAKEEKARAADEEREMLREEERAREDPHEGEILREAQMDDLRERERNWQITEEQSARAAHKDPQWRTPDVSASSFVSEQQRKTDEIARMKREQEDRLRSLNSPLPAPGAPPRYGGAAPASSPSPRPAAGPSSSVRQVASLASMINQKGGGGGGGAAASPSAPVPAAPAPRLSLSEMTRLKKDNGPPASGAAPAAGGGMPSLAEMTRLKKDGAGAGAGGASSSAATTAAPGEGRRPVRQKLPLSGEAGPPAAAKRDGPIRQRLPLGGEEEADEDDDLLRSGRGKAMSIGDYRSKRGGADAGGSSSEKEDEQKRSRMWGVDIDKIL